MRIVFNIEWFYIKCMGKIESVPILIALWTYGFQELFLKSVILYNCVFSSVVFVCVSMSIFFWCCPIFRIFFPFRDYIKYFVSILSINHSPSSGIVCPIWVLMCISNNSNLMYAFFQYLYLLKLLIFLSQVHSTNIDIIFFSSEW